MIFNYKLQNFVSDPTKTDKTLKIYTKTGTLIYSFVPDMAYFYYKNNYVIVKIEDQDNIVLDFETVEIAIKALKKLNKIKKQISEFISEGSNINTGVDTLYELRDTDFTLSALTNDSFLKYDPSISGWTSFELTSLSSTTFTNLNPTPFTVGGIEAGSTFEHQNLSDMMNHLLYPTIEPTMTNKNTSISGDFDRVEVGTNFSFTLGYGFNQGSIDSKDSHPTIDLVGNEISHSFSGPGVSGSNVSYIAIFGTMIWDINVIHNAGTGSYYDSTGTESHIFDSQRGSGNSSTSASKTGSYSQWEGVSTSSLPTDSNSIRSLSSSWIDNDFNISIPQGQTYVAWYRPQSNDTGNLKVIYIESSNADLTTEIIKTSVIVKDANNTDVQYYKYEHYIGGTGYAANATYHITF